MDAWLNKWGHVNLEKREMGTSLWKEGKLRFPQEERILCVNYSAVIKIHAAHLPETTEK